MCQKEKKKFKKKMNDIRFYGMHADNTKILIVKKIGK